MKPWWNTEPDEPEELPVPSEPVAPLRAERDPVTPELELEAPAALYGMVRCETCGRPRLTFVERPMSPCEHGAT